MSAVAARTATTTSGGLVTTGGGIEMKVLVATMSGQGQLAGDYMYCVPGELAWVTMVCDCDLVDPDGGCGCGRGFGGLTSHRATSTVQVADLTITPEELRLAIAASLTDQGWLSDDEVDEVDEAAVLDEVIGDIESIAAHFGVGAVVRRRVYSFYESTTAA